MRCLVVGLGSIGRRHAGNLLSLGHEVIVVRSGRRSDEKQKQFLKQHKLPALYSLDGALKEKPDAVFVTNPTSMHLATARRALQAGAHVFVEKPISHSTSGVATLIALAKRKKRVLVVGYHFRYHPLLRKIHSLIMEGGLGTIFHAQFVTGEYLPAWHPWENYKKGYAARKDLGGGAALTQSHDIDTALWLFGKPKRVRAHTHATRMLGIDVDDIADFSLSTPRAAEVSIHIDYLTRPPVKRLEVFGSKGRILWDGTDGTKNILTITKTDGRAQTKVLKKFKRNDMYIAELKDFFWRIRHDRGDTKSAEDAREVLCIALAAIKNRV